MQAMITIPRMNDTEKQVHNIPELSKLKIIP